jgi:hypothetical protein
LPSWSGLGILQGEVAVEVRAAAPEAEIGGHTSLSSRLLLLLLSRCTFLPHHPNLVMGMGREGLLRPGGLVSIAWSSAIGRETRSVRGRNKELVLVMFMYEYTVT